ncbi:hypothetical protein DFH08DRAFT_799734 [Mycena albidolilacea]|uniref:Uncharacterized protein n=1 Tax=Mycena albidolilacea TaxID=1033008 RepID=A0AAD7F193_9AGAR|nr:hypothetical protein DFH08DRAFT_799734 [Mycena albidolilacea]
MKSFVVSALAISSIVTGTAPGFVFGVTGSGTAPTTFIGNIADLKAALTSKEPMTYIEWTSESNPFPTCKGIMSVQSLKKLNNSLPRFWTPHLMRRRPVQRDCKRILIRKHYAVEADNLMRSGYSEALRTSRLHRHHAEFRDFIWALVVGTSGFTTGNDGTFKQYTDT